MTEASIPVDLLNPGQVFACLGFMETTEILCGPCEGQFSYTGADTAARFIIRCDGPNHPVLEVLQFLARAEVKAIAPEGSGLTARKWDVKTLQSGSAIFPCAQPDTPAALPMVLMDGQYSIPVEHWADGSSRDNVKFWAGMGGRPGASVAKDILDVISGSDVTCSTADPFSISAPLSSGFRFDWRRDYIAIDAGFSPNDHQSSLTMVGYPFVEMLAVIGLQNARPARVLPRDKLTYRYGISGAVLPTLFARAVLGGESFGFPVRTFRMRLGWPGQEGQARCIIDAQEECT